jgi:hypothetical protein
VVREESPFLMNNATPAGAVTDNRPDVVVEFKDGPVIRIPAGTSLTIGRGRDAECCIDDDSVAPLHARIDNRVVPAGLDASHPYCRTVWITDIGGASGGEHLFGPKSRTGVVRDPDAEFVMPLEYGEAAPLAIGTIVLLGHAQFRVIAGV